jgi:hypothetical protein
MGEGTTKFESADILSLAMEHWQGGTCCSRLKLTCYLTAALSIYRQLH